MNPLQDGATVRDTTQRNGLTDAVSHPFTAAMRPKDLPELLRFCEKLSESIICPKALKRDGMAVMVAIQAGERHGFDVLGSIQNIAIINGKPSFYGDAMLGICRAASSVWGGVEETHGGSMADGDAWAQCKVWRKGEEEHPVIQRFDQDMALRAKLIGKFGKSGPWQDYPERMLMFRARGWALRDCFPDLLSGIISAEEAMDYPEVVDAKFLPQPNAPASADTEKQPRKKEAEGVGRRSMSMAELKRDLVDSAAVDAGGGEPAEDLENPLFDDLQRQIVDADSNDLPRIAKTVKECLDQQQLTEKEAAKLRPLFKRRKDEIDLKARALSESA